MVKTETGSEWKNLKVEGKTDERTTLEEYNIEDAKITENEIILGENKVETLLIVDNESED